MNINREDITVQIKLKQSPKTLAQAQVVFFGVIETKGWRVCPSALIHKKFQEPLWIQPPSVCYMGNWRKIVYLNDLTLYELVEEKIYDAYRIKLSETGGSVSEQVAVQVPF